ncbi:MAG: type IV pilus biogenesis/stability protein PilW [Janthinobacterium lividum]
MAGSFDRFLTACRRSVASRLFGATLALPLLGVLGACAGAGGGKAVQSAPSEQLATASDQTEVQRRSLIRLQLAIGYYEQGQMATALDEVKQALAINPASVDALGVRALIYMEMEEPKLAEESFQAAMQLAPGNPDLINNYGWFLCQNGRARESLAYFENALKSRAYLSPAKALNNAGVCSLKLGDEAGGQRYLLQALQFEPGNQQTNANLAKLFLSRDDLERTRYYLGNLAKSDNLSADSLWTAIKIERKLGDTAAVSSYANQLRRNYPTSKEYAALLRGAYNE